MGIGRWRRWRWRRRVLRLGKPVAQSTVHVSAAELAGAPVLPHPLVTPQRTMVVGAEAKAVPAHGARPMLASRTGGEGRTEDGTVPEAPVMPAAPAMPRAPAMEAGRPADVERAAPVERAPGMPAAARPLFHQAEPPPARPSFEEQQRAIETIDPGRPLGPQQMENLRQNRPAGPAQQPEAPHPRAAPAPRPQFSPRTSAPRVR